MTEPLIDSAAVGAVATKAIAQHGDRIVAIAHELSELLPPGCNLSLSFPEGPALLSANGTTPEQRFRQIVISRPVVSLGLALPSSKVKP